MADHFRIVFNDLLEDIQQNFKEGTTAVLADIANIYLANSAGNSVFIKNKQYFLEDGTSFHLEKDALIPSNSFVLVIEDNNVRQFASIIQRGFRIVIFINGKPQMTGYVFNYHISYSKSGGTRLTLECKDLLEYMAQYTCLPHIVVGNKRLNVHFGPKDTLQNCLNAIAEAFYVTSSNGVGKPLLDNPIQVSVDAAHQNLQLGSGFAFGLRTSTSGKSGVVTTNSLTKSLEHLAQPQPGESYLAYMLRMAKLAGCHLKMANFCLDTAHYSETIICKSPSYTFQNGTPFSIVHSYTNPLGNNVISADIKYNLENQPSVVIMEANSTGDGKFHLSTLKGIATNALTAYNTEVDDEGNQAGVSLQPGVSYAIATLTQYSNANNYKQAMYPSSIDNSGTSSLNQDLYDQASNIPINTSTPFAQPHYNIAPNAHNGTEVMIAAAEYLADCQDRYVEMTYVVQGWTMPGTNYVWQPDSIVMVIDDILAPPDASAGAISAKPFPMWIRRVNFTQSKRDGTMTKLTCTLPFTHNVVIPS